MIYDSNPFIIFNGMNYFFSIPMFIRNCPIRFIICAGCYNIRVCRFNIRADQVCTDHEADKMIWRGHHTYSDAHRTHPAPVKLLHGKCEISVDN